LQVTVKLLFSEVSLQYDLVAVGRDEVRTGRVETIEHRQMGKKDGLLAEHEHVVSILLVMSRPGPGADAQRQGAGSGSVQKFPAACCSFVPCPHGIPPDLQHAGRSASKN